MNTRRPILVHQMGKVGSRSVVDSLHATLPEAQIEHVHTLTADGLAGVRTRCAEHGRPVPPHVLNADRIRREVIDTEIDADVITLVREPAGRNMSAFFQTSVARPPDASPAGVEKLCEDFLESYHHSQPLSWFPREFDPIYGTTMLSEPFDPIRGSRVYESGRFRILLLRCELPDADKMAAISGFLGLDTLEWIRSNATGDKAERHAYSRFKEQLRMPPELLDRLYGSTYSMHFYTADEIAGFRAKWSTPRAAGEPSAG